MQFNCWLNTCGIILDQFNRIVTLTEEFKSIQIYVKIRELRFCDRIQFESGLDIDQEWFQAPAMTMQPLVEKLSRAYYPAYYRSGK